MWLYGEGKGGRASRGSGRTRGRSGDQGDGRIDGQGGQNLLPIIVAQVGEKGRGKGNGRNQNGDAVNDNIRGNVSRGCTYKEFLACNPKEYDGKGGVIVYTCWIEKMESVQDMSGCRDNQKVKYTAGSFVSKALMWWNSQIHTRGREAAVETDLWNHVMVGAGHDAYTDRFHELARLVPHLVTLKGKRIERYVYGLSLQIRGMVAATEPKTIQKAMQIAGTLTDESLRNGSLKNNHEKRGNRGEPSKDSVSLNFIESIKEARSRVQDLTSGEIVSLNLLSRTRKFGHSTMELRILHFFCEVLQYFKVHISILNPFGCAKLTTFIIMCKAYGCKPSVDLFQGFFNLCRAGSWLNFQKDSIISSKYPQLLLDENMLNLKSFKDKLPPNIDENHYFQRLGRYLTSVRMFDDPIMFLAGLKPSWEFGQQRPAIIVGGKEMAFRNFIYTEDDDDLAFLPKEPSPGFGTGSPSASVNTELPKDDGELNVASRIKERKCKTRGGSSRPLVKRKLASGLSSSHAVRAKTSASKDDAPILSISDDDEGHPDCFELKDANAYHLKIAAITPPAWKGHLDNQMDLELLDLHDRCYAQQAMVDNAVNRRAREFLQLIENMSGEADVIKTREISREEEHEELQVKCKAAMAEFDQNPAVLAFREKISLLTADVKEHKGNLDRMMLECQKWAGYQVTLSTLESKVDSLEVEKAKLEAVEVSLRREVEELKQDRRDVVSKVIPYAAMELVHSDELGR
ncbi:hypothetical protein Tco_1388093, partial [Tanacetum coccineum]